MSIDVTPLATLFKNRQIVLPRQQADVVDLRDARRKELDGARSEIGIVIRAEHGVVGTANLMNVKAVWIAVFRRIDQA